MATRGGNHGGMSLKEVACSLGISRARVSQLEERALRKLRARPGLMKKLRELVALQRQLREEKEREVTSYGSQ